jgi:hypothetical protein
MPEEDQKQQTAPVSEDEMNFESELDDLEDEFTNEDPTDAAPADDQKTEQESDQNETEPATETAEPDAQKDESGDQDGPDETLLQRARDMGLTDDDAKAISSPDVLDRLITRMEMKFAERLQNQPANSAPDPAPAPADAQPAKGEAAGGRRKGGEGVDDAPPSLDGLEPEIESYGKWTTDQIGAMRREMQELRQQLAQERQTQQQQFQQQRQATQAQTAKQKLQQFEAGLDGLAPEYEGVFGKGNTNVLPAESPERQNRVKLAKAIHLLETHARSIDPNAEPDFGSLFRRALNAEFPEAVQKAMTKQAEASIRQRKAQATTPPNGRRRGADTLPRGKDKAAQFADKFFADRGMGRAPQIDDIDDL